MTARLHIPPPPEDLTDGFGIVHAASFVPAHDLTDAVMRIFVEEGGPLANEDHAHLQMAQLGFLWTDAAGKHQGSVILGTAEMFTPRGPAWVKARQVAQMLSWFGQIPDFVITLSAPFVGERLARGDAWSVCALIEHELYHCGHALDGFGNPRFRRSTGLPVWYIKGHDVEEHIGVVERYGAYSPELQRLVAAANRGPSVARADVAGVCGSCLRRVV